MKYKNWSISSDSVIGYNKRYDRFRAILGNTYFYLPPNIYKVNGRLEVRYEGEIVEPPASDLGVLSDDLQGPNAGSIGTDLPLFTDSGVVDVGNGLNINLGPMGDGRLRPIQTESSTPRDPRPNPLGQGGGDDIFIRPLDITLPQQSQQQQPLVPQGIVESDLSTTIQTEDLNISIETKIDVLKDIVNSYNNFFGDLLDTQNINFTYNVNVENEDLILAQHTFDVILELYSRQSPNIGWKVYNCRVFSPQLSVLLQERRMSFSNMMKLNTSSVLYPLFAGYIYYFKKLMQYLQENIETKSTFMYYNFYYNSSLSHNGEKEISVVDLRSVYNYYYKDLEESSSYKKENEFSHLYDIYLFKSFDSRNQSCLLRNERMCYANLSGTQTNIAVYIDDSGELDVANSIYTKYKNLAYGVSFSLPIYYSSIAKIIKDRMLFNRYCFDVYKNNYLNTLDVSKKIGFYVLYEGEYRYVENNVVSLDDWLIGVAGGKFGNINFDNFDTTIYDFGFMNNKNDIRTKNDLSIFTKKVLANDALTAITSSKTMNLLDVFKNNEFSSESFGYVVHKYKTVGETSEKIQNESFFAVNNQMDNYSFFDTQVYYGFKYEYYMYNVLTYEACDYYYEKDYKNINIEEDVGAIRFDIHQKNYWLTGYYPYFYGSTIISDSPPAPPVVSVDTYRDKPFVVTFYFRESAGGERGKYIIVDQKDQESYAKYEEAGLVDENGEIFFKNDDYAREYEVYVSNSRPRSYADFRLVDIVSNVLKVGEREVALSSNDYTMSLEKEKKYYFYFRQIDVHGNRSNPTSIYILQFSDFGDRSVLDWSVKTAEEVFKNKKYLILNRPVRKFLVFTASKKEKVDITEREKKYKIKLISRKTNRCCEMSVKILFKNNYS